MISADIVLTNSNFEENDTAMLVHFIDHILNMSFSANNAISKYLKKVIVNQLFENIRTYADLIFIHYIDKEYAGSFKVGVRMDEKRENKEFINFAFWKSLLAVFDKYQTPTPMMNSEILELTKINDIRKLKNALHGANVYSESLANKLNYILESADDEK